MKTSYLVIITGAGIASVISFALIVVIIPSSLADQAGMTIGVEQNQVGVGEPISFFVEISSPLQNSMYPTAVIVDEQNQTVWSDDDLPPNGYKGMTKVYYVQRDSENVPVINQTGKYTLIVTFADKKASKDLTVTGTIRENSMLHYYGVYTGMDKENTDMEIADQSYYLTTVHKTPSDLTAPNDTLIQFHGVAFTFPGCGQCLPMPTVSDPPYYVHVQFQDKTNETLEIRDNQWSTIGPPMDFHEYLANGTKIFPNGTRGTWAPRFHMDPIVTVFSNHEHPQAGITVTHDSMKFLVSADVVTSSQSGPLGNAVHSTAFENQSVASHVTIISWPPRPAVQHITVVIGVNNTIRWVNEGIRDDVVTANNDSDPDFAKAAPYFGNHFDGTLVNSTQVGPNETEIFYKDSLDQVRSFFSEPARYAHNVLGERNPFFEYTFTRVGTFGYHGEPWEMDSVTVLAPLSNVAVPEFPFVVPMLLASFTSLIVFYRIKFVK